jgi:CPA1 family monovalent cation:H+ antiporter
MTEAILIAVVAVLVIAAATAVGPRLKIAGPLLLVLLGLGVSLLPFVPPFELDPEVILVGVLPPLLYSSAVALPAIEFRRDVRPISGLAVILVLVSAVALGFFFHAVIPGLDLYLAIALGAILSPTDAVATSIAKRLGISRRVTTWLDGESLLNDATSLVILRTMVATAVMGSVPEGGIIGAFAWGVFIAVVVGALVGYLNLRIRALISHSAANTAIGFIVPFVAYLPTEALGGSGLVAAVMAGIVTGQGAARRFTPEQRLSDELNWRTVELVLEGAVFLVMGLELKELLDSTAADGQGGLARAGALALTAVLIILAARAGYVGLLVWVESRRGRRAGDRLPRARAWLERVPERARPGVTRLVADLEYHRTTPLGWRHGVVMVWAGMRGVVTLAAAQTLPQETPARDLLVLVAFFVAVGSLVVQGSTLPWLVRLLRLDAETDETVGREERLRLDGELRSAAAAAIADDLRRRNGDPFPPEMLARVGDRYTRPPDEDTTAAVRDILELRLALIRTMRERLTELSSDGTFSTAVLRHALAELDADELSLELRLGDEDD